MSLMNRRREYTWAPTSITDLKLIPESRNFGADDKVKLNLGFRVIGGLREALIPDVWTVAWEDNDKMVRLTMTAVIKKGGPLGKTLATTGKEVRRAKFYWSRDPDLPFRVWTAIIHEDGRAPIIPLNVEDAKSQFLDVVKTFEFDASSLGRGTHKVVGAVNLHWGRTSYLEKGALSGKTAGVQLKVG